MRVIDVKTKQLDMSKRLGRLEIYGYRDQNTYNGYQDATHEINHRQDGEIGDLGCEIDKLSEKVDELEEKVDSLSASTSGITKLDKIEGDVEALSGAVIGLAEDIDDHEDRISAIEENDAAQDDEIANIQDAIEALKGSVDEVSGTCDDLKNEVSGISSQLETILGKDFITSGDVESIYVKKDDVYTKDECDERFLTEHQSLDSYYKKGETYSKQEVDDKIATVNGNIDRASGEIQSLQSGLAATNNNILALKGDVSSISGATLINASNISVLSAQVASNTASISNINGELASINDTLATKADKTAIDAETQAREEDVDELWSAITQQGSELEETARTLQGEIDANESAINDLSDALAREIQDRTNSDNAIIGNDGDTYTTLTLNGVKAFAQKAASDALNDSKAYTDGKYNDAIDIMNDELDKKADKKTVTSLSATVDTEIEALRTQLIDEMSNRDDAKETSLKAYVDEKVQALKNELMPMIDANNAELRDAIHKVETNVESFLSQLTEQLEENGISLNITLPYSI